MPLQESRAPFVRQELAEVPGAPPEGRSMCLGGDGKH